MMKKNIETTKFELKFDVIFHGIFITLIFKKWIDKKREVDIKVVFDGFDGENPMFSYVEKCFKESEEFKNLKLFFDDVYERLEK